MTKQGKIREGMEKIRREAFGDDGSAYFTDAILRYQDSQGVVIKVDREPGYISFKVCEDDETRAVLNVYPSQPQLEEIGYAPIESLIEK